TADIYTLSLHDALPIFDKRYHEEMVVSHDSNQIRSTPVPSAATIRLLADGCDVVGIDEAKFFDDEIVTVCNDLANRGVRVIVARSEEHTSELQSGENLV